MDRPSVGGVSGDLRFHVERPAVLPGAVHTDEKRLRSVLIELLSNAMRFTAAGEVVLRLGRHRSIAELTAVDSGPGIAERDRIAAPGAGGARCSGRLSKKDLPASVAA